MVEKAVAFATKSHEGTFRKGTKIPYIVHPLETAVIVALMVTDEELICAALLHDVAEDAGVTEEELEREFGHRVARLIMEETEDKTKSWKERKSATLAHLEYASRDSKILVLADKLSNLRTTARDYFYEGEAVWQRFNEKNKEEHAWYYKGIADRLEELNEFPAYQEYVKLCERVFG
ncbi:HD domain-containing protein [Lachnospiraceae bacterium 54-53]